MLHIALPRLNDVVMTSDAAQTDSTSRVGTDRLQNHSRTDDTDVLRPEHVCRISCNCFQLRPFWHGKNFVLCGNMDEDVTNRCHGGVALW